MRTFYIIILFIQNSVYSQTIIYTSNNGTISFKSEAPHELISAKSSELKCAIDGNNKNFAFRIRINSFEGFNSPLQKEHFNENYMETSKFPEATFSGKIIEEIDLSKNGIYSVRAKGALIVHGISQERIIRSTIEIFDKQIKITAQFSVLLSDYNIPIPRIVREKLSNEIKVEVRSQLQAK